MMNQQNYGQGRMLSDIVDRINPYEWAIIQRLRGGRPQQAQASVVMPPVQPRITPTPWNPQAEAELQRQLQLAARNRAMQNGG